MKCMVTGATGFIGSRLVEELISRGYQVNALVRSPGKIPEPIREKINIFQGDVLDENSIHQAIKDCSIVFHLAAFADIWAKDQMLPYKINVTGTKNILSASLKNNIRRVIYTSSAGTLSASDTLKPVDENTPLPVIYETDYELSKRQAEELCMEYFKLGLNIVVVNPTRVFGPGPLNKSNSMTLLIKKYMTGKWRFLPGSGKYTGNYVFIDDVINGHLLAMDTALAGEKYILGGSNATFVEFFNNLAEISGKHYKLMPLPFSLINIYSEMELFMAEHFEIMPVITPAWVRRYRQHRLVSSRKAIEDLGYEITPLPQALGKTVQWLQSSGHL